jgi:hypothetical protein
VRHPQKRGCGNRKIRGVETHHKGVRKHEKIHEKLHGISTKCYNLQAISTQNSAILSQTPPESRLKYPHSTTCNHKPYHIARSVK